MYFVKNIFILVMCKINRGSIVVIFNDMKILKILLMHGTLLFN